MVGGRRRQSAMSGGNVQKLEHGLETLQMNNKHLTDLYHHLNPKL
jgi:hypothetical protein